MTDPKDKPKTASLLSTMTPETVTLEDAKRLLSLPRVVGEHPEGGEILAQNGRYGPYLTWEKETRSLEDENQIFTVDLDGRARALRPTQGARASRRGQPLADLAEDPVTKRHVVVRSGRFGLYVTDGETNATLRIGDTPETMSLDRASELLAERRNAEPSTLRAQGDEEGDEGTGEEGDEEDREENDHEDADDEGAQDDRHHQTRRRRQGRGGQRRAARSARARRLVSPRGVFLVFEGIDVSGKSTQARRVAELHDALFTFEPGDTPLGREPSPLAARCAPRRWRP